MTLHRYVPFIKEIKIESASRFVWKFEMNREFLKVVDYFVKWNNNFFCVVCKRCHTTESGLRNCLHFHKWNTIDHFVDFVLIEASV